MNRQKYIFGIFGLALLALATGCKDDPDVIWKPTPYNFVVPPGFPTKMNIPDDNPLTVEGVELGRHLFYDGRLSGRTEPDSLMSCATCHRQSRAFDIGTDHPKYTDPDGRPWGLTGKKTPHATLPLFNLIWNNEGYLWNGLINVNNPNLGNATYGVPATPEYHLKNIESLAWMGIAAPHEMNGHPDKTVALLKTIPMYPPMFEAAFGTPDITYDRISKAIAQFVRTIISYNSKAHQVFRGETSFSTDERLGYILFTTEEGADCFHCHGSQGVPLFTTHLFYNNAKDTLFTGPNADPRDRYAVTKDPMDLGAYKASTLINIEHQGPYMHDGRFRTLDDVLQFYNSGLKYSVYAHPLMHKVFPPYSSGMNLNPIQLGRLKSFLLTLTDQTLLTEPKYSNPRPNDPYFINVEP
ncbi:MAG TPA: cytochrome c peroxidase [Bacteroidales bacterium]|nr:cytochrome c peroxidase [Bacteroidales bacterium]